MTLHPDPVADQRRAALEHANRIRTYRAILKESLKDADPWRARNIAADVIDAPYPEALTMRVESLLLAVPGLGRVKVRRMMTNAKVGAHRTVGGLSPRQRDELHRMLTHYRER